MDRLHHRTTLQQVTKTYTAILLNPNLNPSNCWHQELGSESVMNSHASSYSCRHSQVFSLFISHLYLHLHSLDISSTPLQNLSLASFNLMPTFSFLTHSSGLVMPNSHLYTVYLFCNISLYCSDIYKHSFLQALLSLSHIWEPLFPVTSWLALYLPTLGQQAPGPSGCMIRNTL